MQLTIGGGGLDYMNNVYYKFVYYYYVITYNNMML